MIAESMLPEFDHEMATTRTLLERVPAEHAAWKPHGKSMTMGELSTHIANLPRWVPMTVTQTELDLNPPGGPPYTPDPVKTGAALLDAYDTNVQNARAALAATADSEMMVAWTLKNGGATVLSMPRVAILRSFVMNHIIHHRGQLSVYLRLKDVALPPIYGPTADTKS